VTHTAHQGAAAAYSSPHRAAGRGQPCPPPARPPRPGDPGGRDFAPLGPADPGAYAGPPLPPPRAPPNPPPSLFGRPRPRGRLCLAGGPREGGTVMPASCRPGPRIGWAGYASSPPPRGPPGRLGPKAGWPLARKPQASPRTRAPPQPDGRPARPGRGVLFVPTKQQAE
jgi:hypothetical protein